MDRGDAPTDPALLSLTQVLDLIRRAELSSETLARACLDRIGRFDAAIRAWTWLDAGRMVDRARAADRALRDGAPTGTLAGAPIAVKDVIHTGGIPTRMGSPLFESFVPEVSAACVERLEAAGAYVAGKTVTTEFANRMPGPTANPWDPSCTPGGSSSGSAAAVAAGFVPAALGTQTLGSTIRPAVYCGIVGYKPSFGLVSRYGVHPLSPSLDHVGILVRTVDDAALIGSCLVGYDSRDPASLVDADRYRADLATLQEPGAPLRFAIIRTPFWDRVEPAQRERFEADCIALEHAGARTRSVTLPTEFADALGAAAVIQAAEAGFVNRELRERGGDRMSESFRGLCDRGRAIHVFDYLAALELRDRLKALLIGLFDQFDAIVTPAAAGEAPVTLANTGDATFCATWSMCGLPAVALPTGVGPRGLPMGLQVVGPPLSDRLTLEAARWCASHLPFRSLELPRVAIRPDPRKP